MHASVTVPMTAPADEIWNIVADVRNTGKFSTEVTESFRMTDSAFTKVFAVLGGQFRTRRNQRDMRKTLERIKAVVEAPAV